MSNVEKVIKGLELCLTPTNSREDGVEVCHEECPYFAAYNMGDCVRSLAKDALALLKAQEPVKPLTIQLGTVRERKNCGECGGSFFGHEVNFCPWCGRAVKWE